MINLLDTKIEYLKGVGPKRAAILNKEAGITTFSDLLNYFPFRYIDKSRIYKVMEVANDEVYYQLVGRISNLKAVGEPRTTRITATFTDDSGSIELVWFKGLKWIKTKFESGKKYLLFGKASVFNNKFNFVHPDIEPYDELDQLVGESLQGVYTSTENMKNQGLGSKQIAKLAKGLLAQVGEYIPETLPSLMLQQQQLIALKHAYQHIHLPADKDWLRNALQRLRFDEYFFFQLRMLRGKKLREKMYRGIVFPKVGTLFHDFYNNYLPFGLTNAQKRVVKEIRADMGSGTQMNRLLQGDVGSGKTIVALLSMLIALDNGYQAILMAPTEILAVQHYQSISALLRGLPVGVALLTGSTRAAERKIIHEGLRDESLHVIIGTHALIEEHVVISKPGLVIIDEQHRFGVAQRAKLWDKGSFSPHVLVMTATPIPRTLAMTQYGDLDFSVIDELPPGRKPVKTIHMLPDQRLKLLAFIRKKIAEGRQVYIVYPLIKESEKLDLINLKEGYDSLLRDFPEPEYQICVVHGQLKSEDKDWEMQRFIKKQAHIMVATTVIEVGVDVPNASVMVIEHADRFGLSQLHQLRGRVGRGAEQSYCILITDHKLTSDAKKRLETMVRTNDGFEIAAVDLSLRGPGETMGTRQSGQLEFKLGDLSRDEQLIRHVRELATELIQRDPDFEQAENEVVRNAYKRLFHASTDWSRIG
jgi:ATP-dependent DNA helicase RecG